MVYVLGSGVLPDSAKTRLLPAAGFVYEMYRTDNFLAMHASTNLHRFLLITSEDLNTLLFILITENARWTHNKEYFFHVIISVIFLYYLSS